MAAPFRFLDRIDVLVGGPASVLDSVRSLVLPGGDRPVTRASDASRIPAESVRAHVVGVALDVVTERVREGLVAALAGHLATVREEYELLEGDDPGPQGTEQDAMWESHCWNEKLNAAVRDSLSGSDVHNVLGAGVLSIGVLRPENIADAVLAAPVDDPTAVLARAGVDAAALEAIVDEIQSVHKMHEVIPPWEWSFQALAEHIRICDKDLAVEGVAYVLTDVDMLETGAELLQLNEDAAFLGWARDRLMFSTPEEDAATVAEVLRLAEATEEGGDASDIRSNSSTRRTETAAGADEGDAPAAQFCGICEEPIIKTPSGTTCENGHGGADVKDEKPQKPVFAEPSDLTRAVSAALAAMFDHGCESDKAMAAALGVERSVVAGARKGTAPWAPTPQQGSALWALVAGHADALDEARRGLVAALGGRDDVRDES